VWLTRQESHGALIVITRTVCCRSETARCRYERQTEGPNFRCHISSYRAVSDEIPTVTPMFSGANFLMAILPMSPDLELSRKSNMSASKPEVIVPPKLRQILSKFQRLHPLFRVDASTGGNADVARRRSLPEIQHGRQQTGSTSISETTTDIVEIPTATPAFQGRRVHWRQCRRRPTSISPGNPTWPPANRKY